jgi:short-subunit dehydrogenase
MYAVVTGGSSGIGLALARRLVGGGYEVSLVARGTDRLQAARAELGDAVTIHACDVGEPDAVARLAAELRAAGRARVDLLVCNAGVPGRQSALDVDALRARAVMAIDYHGMVDVTRALWPELVAARGTVVNVCSVAGTVAVPRAAPYSAAKHAAVGWSRALAAAARPHGVHVVTVNPGPVATPGFPQHDVRRRPLGRFLVIDADTCAAAIVRAVERRRTEVYVPGFWRVVAVLQALAPATVARIAGRVASR